MTTIEFNIIQWETTEIQKAPKLTKKQRKICRLLDIPIPPRRVYETAKIKIDKFGAIGVGDAILVALNPEPQFFIVTKPTDCIPGTEKHDPNGYYTIASKEPLWYASAYTGSSVVVYNALKSGV